jgi:hypothetical protein
MDVFRVYVNVSIIWPIWAETCSKDNTFLYKGHADIVAYKGVFIYFLQKLQLTIYKHVFGLIFNQFSRPIDQRVILID